jgi:hypothetical protein
MVAYFSYGSNMNQANMDRFCDKIGRSRIDLKTRLPRVGILEGYRLDFNYHSTLMGGGAANLEPSEGDHVEGVLFEMTGDDMVTLDEKEKAPSYFHRISVKVTLDNGSEVRNVVAYVACEDRKGPFSAPTKAYKQDILEGARAYGLSDVWIRRIESLPIQPG